MRKRGKHIVTCLPPRLIMADPRVCIVISNQDAEATIGCLDCLGRMNYPKFVVCLLNGDPKSTPLFRGHYSQAVIHSTPPGLRSAASANLGLAWALSKPFPWICLLPCSAKVEPDFLQTFANQLRNFPGSHLFGTCDVAQDTLMQPISSSALFIHRSVPQTIGLLEPRYHLCWEDLDYCFRARRKGFQVHVSAAKVWIPNEPPDSYFWWLGRFLWIERNLPPSEQREVTKRLIRSILRQNFSLIFRRKTTETILARRSLKAVWDYFLN